MIRFDFLLFDQSEQQSQAQKDEYAESNKTQTFPQLGAVHQIAVDDVYVRRACDGNQFWDEIGKRHGKYHDIAYKCNQHRCLPLGFPRNDQGRDEQQQRNGMDRFPESLCVEPIRPLEHTQRSRRRHRPTRNDRQMFVHGRADHHRK